METGLLLIPQPAQYRTVFLGTKRRRLFFPHSLFAIHYNKSGRRYNMTRLQVAFSQEPITGKNDKAKLYGIPLSNADGGFNICLYTGASGDSLKDLAREAIGVYWSTSFQKCYDDYYYWVEEYTGTGLAKRWYADPESIMSEELRQPYYIMDVGRLKTAVRAKITVMPKVTDKVKIKLPKTK